MMNFNLKIYMFLLGVFINLNSAYCDIIKDLRVKSSSGDYNFFKKANAIDGKISNESRWIATKGDSDNIWLEIELLKETSVKAIALYSGFGENDAVQDFHIQFKNESGDWEPIESSLVSGNTSVSRLVSFKNSVQAKSFKLVINKTKDDLARVKELILYTCAST